MRQRSTRAALVGLLIALPAAATVVIAQSLEEMARGSPVIVRANIGTVQAAWAPNERTIETWVEVQVTEVLKGKVPPGATLVVRSPGGVVGNVGAHVSGAPTFSTGEDTLLLLEPAMDAQNVWVIAGLSAGKIVFAKNGFGELRAIRDTRGITFAERSGATQKFRVADRPEDLGTPAELLARVKKAVGR